MCRSPLRSLIIVVSIKYLVFILRADNGGEGGILALMALARKGVAWLVDLQKMAVA